MCVRNYIGRLVARLNCRFAHLFKLQRQPRDRERERELERIAASGGSTDWHYSTIFHCTMYYKCETSKLIMASVKIGPSIDWATSWPVRGSKPDRVFPKHPDRFRSPSNLQWVPVFFSRGKEAGAWIWSHTSISAKVKNEWSYSSTPPICLHDMYRDISAFYFTILDSPLEIRNQWERRPCQTGNSTCATRVNWPPLLAFWSGLLPATSDSWDSGKSCLFSVFRCVDTTGICSGECQTISVPNTGQLPAKSQL